MVHADVQSSNGGRPNPLILVVDDLDEARASLGGWLKARGFQIAEAASGREAVEVARQVLPDLILMDMKLGEGLDGAGAAASIRGDLALRGVPIVALSGDNTQYCKEKAQAAGMDGYLVKPLDPGELEEVLARHLPRPEKVTH